MEDADICRICGEQIDRDENRVIRIDLSSQAHHRCYWAERRRMEASPMPEEMGHEPIVRESQVTGGPLMIQPSSYPCLFDPGAGK